MVAPIVRSLLLSATFGAVTAGRSTFGLAALGATTKFGPALGVGALGEIVGDKLPSTPSRVKIPGLFGRTAAGGLNGVLIARKLKVNPIPCLLVGAATATACSFVGVRVRGLAAQHFGRDLYGALAEDAIVAAGAALGAKALAK